MLVDFERAEMRNALSAISPNLGLKRRRLEKNRSTFSKELSKAQINLKRSVTFKDLPGDLNNVWLSCRIIIAIMESHSTDPTSSIPGTSCFAWPSVNKYMLDTETTIRAILRRFFLVRLLDQRLHRENHYKCRRSALAAVEQNVGKLVEDIDASRRADIIERETSRWIYVAEQRDRIDGSSAWV
ncbi:hypothetical protein AJ78_07776 [Emergomyces pasteurianus Ep9510]|uniref:Uncharacterized protein n=1 Tax=Emergomyces pasteurianus Ep9510 TaxID=1447872 RepID=A0A1J9P5Q7_9EURO|nr:hypothetical protein AJ78_07776 [Emergomyces pasteurianus Ep9510]